MSRSLDEFRRALEDILPENRLAVPSAAYQQEPRNLIKGQAELLLRPASTAEVSTILRLANHHRIGIVPYGGGTGLVGGQIVPDGSKMVLLSLERMTKIREVNPADNILAVEAGAILADVQQAAAKMDRLFPLSLASEGSCRIGGNLATNAGGINVLRYGNARDLCLGLEVVLPSGEIWSGLSNLRKDNTGFDLKNLLIGSEGTLGVITAASLRLFSRPAERVAAMVAVRSPEAALNLLLTLQSALGETLSAFELMNHRGSEFLRETMPEVRQIFDPAPDWSVLLEIGTAPDMGGQDALMNCLGAALERGEAEDALISQNEAQRQSFWAFRETIPEANRLIGAINSHDISVPRSQVPAFIAKADDALGKLGEFRINCFGHLGDGNLHYNVFPAKGKSRDDYSAQKDQIRETVYGLVSAFGGSVSAEHGIGRLKKGDLERYGDPVKRAAMQAIKSALDPNGIMNPGVIF